MLFTKEAKVGIAFMTMDDANRPFLFAGRYPASEG